MSKEQYMPRNYYMVRCANGVTMYEYGTSARSVRGYITRCFPQYTVVSVEQISE